MENIQDKLVRDVVSRIDDKMKEDFDKLMQRALDQVNEETKRVASSPNVVHGWDNIELTKRDQDLRDKYPDGYIMNSFIKTHFDDELFNDKGKPTINGYAILPREEYEELKKKMEYYKSIADERAERW